MPLVSPHLPTRPSPLPPSLPGRRRRLQDNQVCTLKGSLQGFKFLHLLDLSNNNLRDLDKQLKVLQKFHFLTHLNLKVYLITGALLDAGRPGSGGLGWSKLCVCVGGGGRICC